MSDLDLLRAEVKKARDAMRKMDRESYQMSWECGVMYARSLREKRAKRDETLGDYLAWAKKKFSEEHEGRSFSENVAKQAEDML